MPAPTRKIGHGITMTRAATALAYKIIAVTPPSMKVDVQDASNMASVTYKEKIVVALIDTGQISVKVEWDGTYPTVGVWETTVITIPGSPAKTITVDAAIVEFTPSELNSTDGMEAQMIIEVRGAITVA